MCITNEPTHIQTLIRSIFYASFNALLSPTSLCISATHSTWCEWALRIFMCFLRHSDKYSILDVSVAIIIQYLYSHCLSTECSRICFRMRCQVDVAFIFIYIVHEIKNKNTKLQAKFLFSWQNTIIAKCVSSDELDVQAIYRNVSRLICWHSQKSLKVSI